MGAGRRKFLGMSPRLTSRRWEEVAPELQGFVRMTVDAMSKTADWIIDPEGGFSFIRPLTAPIVIGGEEPIKGAIGEGTVQIEGFDAKACLLLHETFNSSETRAGIEILKRRDVVWTALSAGDQIGGITWSGADGDKASIAATVHVDILGTVSADTVPGNIVFSTESTGGSFKERVEINETGLKIFNIGVAGEGGEITFEAPGGSYTDSIAIDSFQDTLRFLNSGVGAGVMAFFSDAGHFRPGTTGTFDIGSTTNAWRDFYNTGVIEMQESGAASAPAANRGRLYLDDSGGKTRLMIVFNTGAAQQIAIQP